MNAKPLTRWLRKWKCNHCGATYLRRSSEPPHGCPKCKSKSAQSYRGLESGGLLTDQPAKAPQKDAGGK